jgi:hypothetical protein
MAQQSGAERMINNMYLYLRAGTEEEARLVLLTHPELTNDAGHGLLTLLFSDRRMHELVLPGMTTGEARRRLEQRIGLINLCRQVGMRAAFASPGTSGDAPAVPPAS